MKLISLNIWGGKVYEPLIAFIKEKASEADIFCFQEVLFGTTPSFTPIHQARSNIFSEIASQLPDFVSYQKIASSGHFQVEPITFGAGQAIFVRRSLEVKNNGGFHCYENEPPAETILGGRITGNCQWVEIADGSSSITITNLHGLWQEGSSKADTPERLIQSRMVKKFLDEKTGKKILCGDFNLLPKGESMNILEDGMKNLIKIYAITSTRSSLYKKDVKFADYILVSSEVIVTDFKVLPDEVSDHLAMYLDFK